MSDVLVLCYHAVSPNWEADLSVRPEALERQLEMLSRRGYRGATFSRAVTEPPARRTVAVTFDDAYRSVIQLARPILEEFGFPGLSYILSAVWWSARLAREGANRHFADAFKETYHRDPDWYSALAYESARALLTAIASSGDAKPESVRVVLNECEPEHWFVGGESLAELRASGRR